MLTSVIHVLFFCLCIHYSAIQIRVRNLSRTLPLSLLGPFNRTVESTLMCSCVTINVPHKDTADTAKLCRNTYGLYDSALGCSHSTNTQRKSTFTMSCQECFPSFFLSCLLLERIRMFCLKEQFKEILHDTSKGMFWGSRQTWVLKKRYCAIQNDAATNHAFDKGQVFVIVC